MSADLLEVGGRVELDSVGPADRDEVLGEPRRQHVLAEVVRTTDEPGADLTALVGHRDTRTPRAVGEERLLVRFAPGFRRLAAGDPPGEALRVETVASLRAAREKPGAQLVQEREEVGVPLDAGALPRRTLEEPVRLPDGVGAKRREAPGVDAEEQERRDRDSPPVGLDEALGKGVRRLPSPSSGSSATQRARSAAAASSLDSSHQR